MVKNNIQASPDGRAELKLRHDPQERSLPTDTHHLMKQDEQRLLKFSITSQLSLKAALHC